MIHVGGVPFVRHVVREFARFGIEKLLFVAGYKGELVASELGGAKLDGAEIEVVVEPEPRGTAGALDFVKELLDPQFVVANGDTLFVTNLARFLADPLPDGVDARLLTRLVDDASRYGSVETHPDGRIIRFSEKRRGTGRQAISAGICILRSEPLGNAIVSLPCSLEFDVFPRWAAQRRMEAMCSTGYFIDIGLPETYQQACDEIPSIIRRPAGFIDQALLIHTDTMRPRQNAIEAIAAINQSGRYVFVVSSTRENGQAIVRANSVLQNELMLAGAHIDSFCQISFAGSTKFEDVVGDWPIMSEGSFLVSDAASAVQFASSIGIGGKRLIDNVDLTETVRAAITEFRGFTPFDLA
jgi:D-glycero-D-manno-heptose 1,7-bisphosphate phosphatase